MVSLVNSPILNSVSLANVFVIIFELPPQQLSLLFILTTTPLLVSQSSGTYSTHEYLAYPV